MLNNDPLMRPSLPEIKMHPWFLGETMSMDDVRQDFRKRRQNVEQ